MPNDLVKREAKRLVPSFWDTKEGTTGMVVGLGLVGGLGWGLYRLMPLLANLMENTFLFVLFLALTAGLLYLIFEGSLRRVLWMRYQLLMRALTYSVFEEDPAFFLRETQKAARKRLAQIEQARDGVGAQVETLGSTLDRFKAQAKEILTEAQHLRARGGKTSEIESRAMKLQELNDACAELQPVFDVTSKWHNKLNEACENLLQIDSNTEFKIGIRVASFNATRHSRSAWRLVKAAFAGSDEIEGLQNDMFDHLDQDYSKCVAEIDSLMNDSQKFMDAANLRKEISTGKGMQLLDELSKRELSIIKPAAPELLKSDPTTTVSYSEYIKK